MQAMVEAHGEITVVSLRGRVELECVDAFQKVCLTRFKDNKIVFDLKGLSFVGSTGITPFLSTLGRLIDLSVIEKPRFVGLSPEFRRLFSLGELKTAKIYSDRVIAFNSFYFEPEDPGFI